MMDKELKPGDDGYSGVIKAQRGRIYKYNGKPLNITGIALASGRSRSTVANRISTAKVSQMSDVTVLIDREDSGGRPSGEYLYNGKLATVQQISEMTGVPELKIYGVAAGFYAGECITRAVKIAGGRTGV